MKHHLNLWDWIRNPVRCYKVRKTCKEQNVVIKSVEKDENSWYVSWDRPSSPIQPHYGWSSDQNKITAFEYALEIRSRFVSAYCIFG